ncbi:MAG: hypothetical protein OEU84_01765 [Xanthomonadales bacterium]|nr:hypothetical protein [Xanthomonadales bacterium]
MRLVTSLVFAVLLLTACDDELTVEQQVIATIRNMEYAAEEGQHLEFMTYIAESFGAQQGSMDRREFHRFMIFQINQNRRLQAQIFPIYVTETGEETASAQFRILVTGGAGLLPESGRLFDVETNWLRDGGDWQLNQADWEPLSLPDLPTVGE